MFTWVGHLSLFKKIVVGYSKENIFFFLKFSKIQNFYAHLNMQAFMQVFLSCTGFYKDRSIVSINLTEVPVL